MAHGCTHGGEGANGESMSGHWKDGSSELDIGGVGGGFVGGGAGRRSRSGMMLGLQVMTARAKELVIMSAAVGARGIINGLLEALAPVCRAGRRDPRAEKVAAEKCQVFTYTCVCMCTCAQTTPLHMILLIICKDTPNTRVLLKKLTGLLRCPD